MLLPLVLWRASRLRLVSVVLLETLTLPPVAMRRFLVLVLSVAPAPTPPLEPVADSVIVPPVRLPLLRLICAPVPEGALRDVSEIEPVVLVPASRVARLRARSTL